MSPVELIEEKLLGNFFLFPVGALVHGLKLCRSEELRKLAPRHGLLFMIIGVVGIINGLGVFYWLFRAFGSIEWALTTANAYLILLTGVHALIMLVRNRLLTSLEDKLTEAYGIIGLEEITQTHP